MRKWSRALLPVMFGMLAAVVAQAAITAASTQNSGR